MPSPLFLLCFMLCISHAHQIILLPLRHSISKTQFNSTHHLLKTTSTRSVARFHRHRQSQNSVSLPLSSGSDYTLSFNLGSHPSQSITLYMDTGSDLVWFPCAPFQCILCEGKFNATTPLKLTRSHRVSCQSPACSAAHSSMSSHDLCAIARCPLDNIETFDCSSATCPPFYYAYGDGSFIARLYRDSLSMSSLFLKNFTFGCAHTALAEPTGVAGFGWGLLSLPAQLATLSPNLGNRFSYCLVSHSFDEQRVRKPSPLILGRYDDSGEGSEFVYTSMLRNPKHPYFYCVGLSGISVGKRTILAPELKRDHVHVASHRSRVYQTKTILGGKVREIQIDCDAYSNEDESLRLVFSVDEEKVLEVTRLKWKFRGSERVEVDGAHVQISWDVHDWLFEKDKDHGFSNISNDVNVNGNSDGGKNEGHAVFMFKFENDEVGCGSGKEVDVVWSSGEWKNGKSWSSSSLSVSSSVGSFGGSSSVMEWSSVEENELVVTFGFSLVVYAWRK